MKTIVHVNLPKLRQALKSGLETDVITAKTYKSNNYGRTAVCLDQCDNVFAKVCSDFEGGPIDSLIWMEFPYGIIMRDDRGISHGEYPVPAMAKISRSNIAANIHENNLQPVIEVFFEDDCISRKCFSLDVLDSNGEIAGSLIYSAHKPLSCGARAWFETQQSVCFSPGEFQGDQTI